MWDAFGDLRISTMQWHRVKSWEEGYGYSARDTPRTDNVVLFGITGAVLGAPPRSPVPPQPFARFPAA